jgi:hypothetical protein
MSTGLLKWTVLSGALLGLCVHRQSSAAVLDPRYSAGVDLQNLGDYHYEGQSSAGGRIATGTDAAVVTEGGAAFSQSPAEWVNTTSVPGRGVTARAYLDDTLTFHVPGGGATDVDVHMAGNWRAARAGEVDYILIAGTKRYAGRAFATGVSESTINGAPTASTFRIASGDATNGVLGSYLVNARLTVSDGASYSLFSQVRATAGDGDRAYMDDPITIDLPAGVTFTAASGSTYAVPEPTALLLCCGGIAALVRPRRR